MLCSKRLVGWKLSSFTSDCCCLLVVCGLEFAGDRARSVPLETIANMSTGTAGEIKIEKLNRDNYHTWKFNMKMQLILKDLWDFVQGAEVLPDQPNEKKHVRHSGRKATYHWL